MGNNMNIKITRKILSKFTVQSFPDKMMSASSRSLIIWAERESRFGDTCNNQEEEEEDEKFRLLNTVSLESGITKP